MNRLGALYRDGLGVVQDYAEAREWFQKAADAGNANAMNNLGALYQNGQGVAQALRQGVLVVPSGRRRGRYGCDDQLGLALSERPRRSTGLH
jgi:TPR repeat protein